MGICRLRIYLSGQRVDICIFVNVEERVVRGWIFGRKRRSKCVTKSEGSAQWDGFVEGGRCSG